MARSMKCGATWHTQDVSCGLLEGHSGWHRERMHPVSREWPMDDRELTQEQRDAADRHLGVER